MTMPLQALISQKQHGGTFFFIIEFWSAGQHATFGKVKNIYYIHSASECKIYVLESFRRYSSEIVLQPILFVADVEFDDEEIKRGVPDPPKIEEGLDSQDVEFDDEEIKQGVPDPPKVEEGLDSRDVEFDDEEKKRGVLDPPKLEEVLDSQEESTEVDNEGQVNKNLSPDEADSDTEEKLVASNEEQSSTKTCGFECIIWEKDYMM